jgi:hypothetical protein
VWLTVLTGALVVGGGLALAVGAMLSPSRPGSSAPAPAVVPTAQLTAYQAAIIPTLQVAGGMVEQEIKPSIAALEAGSLSAAEMRSRAVTWESRFQQERAALAAVTVPAGLAGAASGFDNAFRRYDDAATALAGVPDSDVGNADSAQVQAAAALAAQADKLYDAAAAIIQADRRAVGLGPTVDLPDPTPSPAP